jgi:hypothetical protein
MTTPSRDLAVPESVAQSENAREVLRLWRTDDGERVILRTDDLPPMGWGLILVDLAKHISYAYAQQGGLSANDAFSQVISGFIAELGHATDSPTHG